MVDILNNNIKYIKSKQGFTCLGPCYEPGTHVTHPITLNYVYDDDYPFCHVNEHMNVDPETGKKEIKYYDKCYKTTKDKNENDEQKKFASLNMILPFIEFRCEHFLKLYNDIFSFEDAVMWIEKKKYSPLSTRSRIFECAMKSYGKDIDIVNQQIMGYLIELISTKWINDLYNIIGKYLEISGDKIKLGKASSSNNNNIDDRANEKKNYIINKFINSDEIHKFMVKYIKHRKPEWESIENHIDRMKSDFMIYVENKIKSTLNI